MLEVVGVTGVMHLGQIQSGLKSAIRIVQVSITIGYICFLKNYSQIFKNERVAYQCYQIGPAIFSKLSFNSKFFPKGQ